MKIFPNYNFKHKYRKMSILNKTIISPRIRQG